MIFFFIIQSLIEFLFLSLPFAAQMLGIENGREVARKLIGNNHPIQLCSCDNRSNNCAFCGLECTFDSGCLTCPVVYKCVKPQ